MTNTPHILGEREAGAVYRVRPAAYAVILDAAGRVALMWTGRLHFLPGGGMESGETPEETVVRETLEESGHAVSILEKLGEVTEFTRSLEDQLLYEVHGHYFRGVLGARIADPTEPDYELHWFSTEEAVNALHRPGHVWAVQETERASGGFP